MVSLRSAFRFLPALDNTLLNLTALMLASASTAHASNITYYGKQNFANASVSYSITTNGATGVLQAADILAFDFELSDQGGMASITNLNGFIGFNSSSPGYYAQDLSATLTELTFTYSDYPTGGDNLGFFNSTTGAFFCFQANDCYAFTYAGIGESSVGGSALERFVNGGIHKRVDI